LSLTGQDNCRCGLETAVPVIHDAWNYFPHLSLNGECPAEALAGLSAEDETIPHQSDMDKLDFDPDKIDDAVLALLLLGLHDDVRVWKAHDWTALDHLFQKGYISDPASKAKSTAGLKQLLDLCVLLGEFGKFCEVERTAFFRVFRQLGAKSRREHICIGLYPAKKIRGRRVCDWFEQSCIFRYLSRGHLVIEESRHGRFGEYVDKSHVACDGAELARVVLDDKEKASNVETHDVVDRQVLAIVMVGMLEKIVGSAIFGEK
jgi:Domain of unknown function (DUF6429)